MPALHKTSPLVLIVEDEWIVRDCTAAQLEEAGCDVLEAADAEAALRQFQANAHVTTLFTDINMPGPIDGLSLAHKIAVMRPAVQLILTSGRAAPAPSEMPPGGQFLPKPYDYNRLTSLIRFPPRA